MENSLKEFVFHRIKQLDKKDDSYSKATSARLRRAVGKQPGETPDIWEITLQGAPSGVKEQEIIHTVLTLYALHSQGKNESMNDDKTGFGTAIARLIDPEKGNETAIRRRFNAVSTSADYSELAYHARGLIQLLKAKDIKMDYVRFAYDLLFFQNPDFANNIRLKWGNEFYRINVDNQIKVEGKSE
jgi:CRISPR system Cascade subunit CasB